MTDTDNITEGEQFDLFKRGATEHGCIYIACTLWGKH
jgi:hypothetical protein